MKDVKLLHRWINNRRVNRFLGAEIPISLAKEKKWLTATLANKTEKNFIIERADTHEPIGEMSLKNINKRYRKVATGAFIAYPKYWGKGYGSDAKMALLKYALVTLKLNKVVSFAFPHNPRSVRYSEKCGYKREGYLRDNICKKGKFYDSILLGVLKRNWVKLAKRKGYL